MSRTALAVLCSLLLMTAAPAGQLPSDVTDPDVWITSPAEDATVSGMVTITAHAADTSGVAGVVFEVDGAAIGAEDVTEPWSIVWDSAASGGGAHLLTVVARDGVGNAVRSETVPVVVGAGAPPEFPPANHSPVAAADSFTTGAGVALTITDVQLLANDTDVDGHVLSVSLVAANSTGGGSIASNGGGSWTYTPAAGFIGADTFTYSIGDSAGGSASAIVTVNVTGALPAGLVLALGFEEESGLTAFDASGGSRNGTILGATRVAAGKSGRGLQFDGADDMVSVSDSPALGLTTAMAISAWVRPTAFTGWETVVLKERGAGGLAYALYAHDGAPLGGGVDAPAAYLRIGTIDQAVQGSLRMSLDAWSHLAMTYDGTTMRLYVNGAQVASRAQSGAAAVSAGALRIGGNLSFAGEFFQGFIDEVRVYNRGLSAAEVGADMSNGQVTPPEPPANSQPSAGNDSLSTTMGTPVAFTSAMLLANDGDPDGDPISVTEVQAATVAGGSVTGSWTYTPPASYSGPDSFTYTISDGRGGTATGTVNVTVNAPAPPPPTVTGGLVAAYAFDELDGTALPDKSGMGNHGRVSGAVFVGGRSGNALQFDGVDDWVTVPDAASLDLTAGMTIEAWVRPDALGGWNTIALKERGANDLAYGLYAHDGAPDPSGAAVPAGYQRVGTLHRRVGGTSALPVGAWTHVAVTYDGAVQRIYVGGVLVGSRSQTGLIAVSNGVLRIGGNNSFAAEFFAGLIDDLRVYNRALSPAEIETDMNTPVP